MKGQPTGLLRERGILTRRELATELGIRPATLTDWQKRGLPTIKEGMTVLYDLAEVIAWMRRDRSKKIA